MNADGSSQTALTKLTALGSDSLSPAWSPDGSRIIFQSARALDGTDSPNAHAAANVWVMNNDGSSAAPLTEFTVQTLPNFIGSAAQGPTWSPNGNKITFLSMGAFDGSNVFNVNHNENVWVMNADGSNPIPLTKFTAAPLKVGGPVPSALSSTWSPDGSRIAFSSTGALDGSDALNPNGNSNIWIVNADGSMPKALTRLTAAQVIPPLIPTAVAAASNPVWSPDGNKIAFVSTGAIDGSDAVNTNNISNIWVMNADGSSAGAITQFTNLFIPTLQGLSWSPDSKRIVFICKCAVDGSDNPAITANIWVVRTDGSARTPLTQSNNSNVLNRGPAWSPDGTKVVFYSDRDLGGSDNPIGYPSSSGSLSVVFNIWMMNADGSGPKPLTNLFALGATSILPAVP
jgi:Tol biopolymer transport system component